MSPAIELARKKLGNWLNINAQIASCCHVSSAARVAVAVAAAAATVAIGQVNDIALAEAATATAAVAQKGRRLLWPRRVDEQKLDILILENYIENHFFYVLLLLSLLQLLLLLLLSLAF